MPNTINTAATYSRIPAVPLSASVGQGCCCPACTGLECLDRTRFFSGQLLTETDLNNEQSYWLAKGRLHNRFLHGWGVVCGMQVVCSECEGWVTVKTGYAIDPCGNDIIVCEDQPFNLIKAIQACCTPAKTPNCSPLRYTPSPTCQDAEQTWCITIEYQEQPSRLVTPLQSPSNRNKGCGCDCGTNGEKNNSYSSCCSTPASQPSSPVPAGACEPTRIVEGFRLCVIPAPEEDPEDSTPKPGTINYQMALCLGALQRALTNAPALTGNSGQDYQAVCKYLAAVRDALSKAYVTHCQVETTLNGIQVPAPDNSNNYTAKLQAVVDSLVALLNQAIFDCFCTALVPACPPDPCDNRLILACVTVQNGKIINICHFGGRKQVITFPVLYYWLSLFGIDKVFEQIVSLIAGWCCGQEKSRAATFGAGIFEREPTTSVGFSNPAMVNRMMTYFASQKLGAQVVNAAAPTAQAVDLRPYIGQDLEHVQVALQQKYRMGGITTKDVSGDPAWTDAAVAAAPQFAPAAFSLGQPLTIYTTGKQKQVVGFDVTDPVRVLQEQVAQLQTQIDGLRGPAGPAIAPGGGAGPAGKRKRNK